MSSNPPIPAKGKITWQEIISDLPEFQMLVFSIVDLVEKEKMAKTFVERQKLTEPVQESLAALIDKVVAQAATP